MLTDKGKMEGVEAVIDKDLAASLLAEKIQADGLLLLTDVDAVYQDWGKPWAKPYHRITTSDLKGVNFASGSMKPKVQAACRFVEATGAFTGIGKLEDADDILNGKAGTLIRV
jgi:carbamate kinase